MISRRTEKKIPSKVLHDARLLLDEAMNKLEPYLVVLSEADRQALVKMEAVSFRFLELSHKFAVEYPDLFPAFTEAAIFKEEYFTVRELWSFVNKLNQLKDNISDTGMATGTHALETAAAFYHTVKIAARHDIPGARGIYEVLKPKFPSRSRQYRTKNSRPE